MVTNSKTSSLQMPGALAWRVVLLRSTFVKYLEWKQQIKLITLLDWKNPTKKTPKNPKWNPHKNTHNQCKQYLYLLSSFYPREAASKRSEAATLDHKSRKIIQEIRKEEKKTFDQLKADSRLTHPVLFRINNMEAIQRPPMKRILARGTESMWEINYISMLISSAIWSL